MNVEISEKDEGWIESSVVVISRIRDERIRSGECRLGLGPGMYDVYAYERMCVYDAQASRSFESTRTKNG